MDRCSTTQGLNGENSVPTESDAPYLGVLKQLKCLRIKRYEGAVGARHRKRIFRYITDSVAVKRW